MSVADYIKENPLIVAGGAAVAVLILFSGRGAGGGNNIGASLESQRIATEGAVNLASIRGQENIARYEFSRDISQETMRSNAASVLGLFSLGEAINSNLTRKQIAAEETRASREIALSSFKRDVDLADRTADLSKYLSRQEADLAKYLSNQELTALDRNIGFSERNLPMLLDNSLSMAEVEASSAYNMALVDRDTRIAQSQIERDIASIYAQPRLISAKSSRQSNTVNDVIKIGSTVAKVFGF